MAVATSVPQFGQLTNKQTPRTWFLQNHFLRLSYNILHNKPEAAASKILKKK